jgi:SAM-dependent methyltransferase
MTFTETEERTKAIYIEQHKAYVRDPSIFERFYRVASDPSSYGLEGEYFRGKTVIDVGCGNTAYFQKAMFDLGATHVTCVDIGTGWMPELQSALDGLGVPRSFYTMVSGSAVSLPFPDASFDFVASNGVLMHLESVDAAERAFAEHSRICAGTFYLYVGLGRGIVDTHLLPAVRQAYRDNKDLRDYVDGLTPERLQRDLSDIVTVAKEHDSAIAPALAKAIGLLTLDTITFWQNVVQVPSQLGLDLTEEWARDQYARHGFGGVRRTPSVYWPRNDIRRFIAPFHFAAGNPVADLLYGGGHVKMIGDR